jgi:hypothetical protein
LADIDLAPPTDDRCVTTKPNWDKPETGNASAVLPLAVEAVIHRASRLTANEIRRLDLADRSGGPARSVVWDLLRDALDRDPDLRDRRIAARRRAWQAINGAAAAAGLEQVPDDGYWRVVSQPAAGAARLARFAACCLIAPDLLDEEVMELMLEPWLAVVG